MPETNEYSSSDMQEARRNQTTELCLRRTATEGYYRESWRSEAEILRESAADQPRRAVVVNVEGVVYTGEYELPCAEGYMPGEWKPGAPVSIRFAGNQLFLLRANGKELQTTVVKRIG